MRLGYAGALLLGALLLFPNCAAAPPNKVPSPPLRILIQEWSRSPGDTSEFYRGAPHEKLYLWRI